MSVVDPKFFGVAVAQMQSVDVVEENFRQILEFLDSISPSDNIDMVCFPENSLYMRIQEGEKMEGIPMTHSIFSQLQKEADLRKLFLHLGSVAIRVDGRIYNASVSIAPGASPKLTYEKIHLFDIQIDGTSVRESDTYVHGRKPHILNWKGWSLGQTICYDLRFSELYSWYAQHSCEILLIPSSFLIPTGRDHWHVLVRARAIESQAYVIAAAQAGRHESVKGEGFRETYGHSLVVDPWGRVLAEGAGEGAQLLKVILEMDLVQKVRRQIPMANHRRLV